MEEPGEGQKTIAKGTAWNLSGAIILRAVSFVYTILLARLFSEESIGVFYLALSVVYLLSLLGDLGMNAAVSRYLPFYLGKGEKRKAYGLFRGTYVFSGILSTLLAVIVFLSAGKVAESFSVPEIVPALQFLCWFLMVNTFFSLNTAFLKGMKKMKELAILNSSQNVVKLALTVFAWSIFGGEAFAISLSFTLSYVFFVIASFWYLRKGVAENGMEGEAPPLGEQAAIIREALPLGLTLALVGQITTIAFYVDRLMMGYLIPGGDAAAQIGIYSIVTSLVLMLTIFPGSVTSIFAPVVAELYGKGDRRQMGKVAGTTVRWNLFILVPLAMMLLAFPGEILGMFYGQAYAAGAVVLIAFTIGTFFVQLSMVQRTILSSMRIVRAELYVAITWLALNVLLNWLLIPAYGMEGAAVASSISLVVISLMIAYFCRKIAGFSFGGETVRPILAGLVALLLLLLAREPVIFLLSQVPALPLPGEGLLPLILQKGVKALALGVVLMVSTFVYLLCLLALRAIKNEDVTILSKAMGRAGLPGEWNAGLVAFLGRFLPR